MKYFIMEEIKFGKDRTSYYKKDECNDVNELNELLKAYNKINKDKNCSYFVAVKEKPLLLTKEMQIN
jgi:hypothetical protein